MPKKKNYQFAEDPIYAQTIVDRYNSEDPEVKKEAATIFEKEMGGFFWSCMKELYPTYYMDWEEMYHEIFVYCLSKLPKYDPYVAKPTVYFKMIVKKGGKNFIEKNDFIKRNDKEKDYTIQKATKRLEERGVAATPENIVRETDGKISLTVLKRNREIVNNIGNLMSLDEVDDSGNPAVDKFASSMESPDTAAINADVRDRLKKEIRKRLTPIEMRVVLWNVVDGISLEAIGEKLNLSDREVDNAKSMGMSKLRCSPEVRALWGYNQDTATKIREHNLRRIKITFEDDDPNPTDDELAQVDLSLVV